MLNTMHLRTVLRQEASSAEAAPGVTDMGGEDSGESSFFDQIKGADDHPSVLAKKATADPAADAKTKKVETKPVEKPVKEADKLADVIEEPEPEEAKAGDDETPPEGKKEGEEGEKQMTRWTQLRNEEKRARELDKTVAALKKEVEDLRKNPISKEAQAKVDKYEEMVAARFVEQTKEYKDTVDAVLAKAERGMEEICKEFKLDPDKMFEAMKDPVDWKRHVAIDRLVDDADNVPSAIKASLYKQAEQLHAGWLKGNEMKSKAAELRAALDAQFEKTNTEQTFEQQQAWQKAVASSRAMMEKKIAPILKGMTETERKEFTDALDNAQISKDPEERAQQAHGIEVAAVVVRALIAQRKENADLKKTIASLTNARPGVKQAGVTEDDDPNAVKDDDDFFAKVRRADDFMRR